MDGNVSRVGNVQLIGVSFINGGQVDTMNSALVFMNVLNANISSYVTGTSFIGCQANCILIQNSRNITITNNVLYNAWVFGVQAFSVKYFTFNNNLIIGVQ
jgi:parallel beta-helix repeat protein